MRNSSSAEAPAWMKVYIGMTVLPFLVGFIATTSGCHAYLQNRKVSGDPLQVSCASLGEQFYDDYTFVQVTDYRLLDGYVYEEELGEPRWNYVVVPLVPADQEEEIPFHVVVRSKKHRSEREVERLYQLGEIRGLLLEDEDLSISMSRELKAMYPGLRAEGMKVVEIGATPLSANASWGILLFGIFSLTGGVLMVVPGSWIVMAIANPERSPKPVDKSKDDKHLREKLRNEPKSSRDKDDPYARRPGSEYDTVPREPKPEPKPQPKPQSKPAAKPRSRPSQPPYTSPTPPSPGWAAHDDELVNFELEPPKPQRDELVDFVLEEKPRPPGKAEILPATPVDDNDDSDEIIDAEIIE